MKLETLLKSGKDSLVLCRLREWNVQEKKKKCEPNITEEAGLKWVDPFVNLKIKNDREARTYQ